MAGPHDLLKFCAQVGRWANPVGPILQDLSAWQAGPVHRLRSRAL